MGVRFSRRALIAGGATAVVLAIVAAVVVLVVRPSAPGPQPSPSGSPSAAGLRSPFTGLPVTTVGPELIVKIDNVAQARPPTGLGAADIVYLIPVEGGLSRIMAVFSSHIPPVIGPVRSAREDDLQLLRQFGRPAFAFSGAQPRLLPVVEHARIVDLYSGVTRGYFRSASRIAPYNLYARTATLLAQATGVSKARDIGFRFGPAPAGGTPAASWKVSYPAAAFGFTWSAAQRRWLVSMDGKPAVSAAGARLGGPTIVIQHVTVGTSGFLERGSRPPYAQTVGSGRAVVLRDGRAYQVRWSRPVVDGGTTFTLADGQRMAFARGQVWVVLAYR